MGFFAYAFYKQIDKGQARLPVFKIERNAKNIQVGECLHLYQFPRWRFDVVACYHWRFFYVCVCVWPKGSRNA